MLGLAEAAEGHLALPAEPVFPRQPDIGGITLLPVAPYHATCKRQKETIELVMHPSMTIGQPAQERTPALRILAGG